MKSLRWKIIGTTLLVVFIPISLLNRHALSFFDLFTRTVHEHHLRRQVQLLAALARPVLLDAGATPTTASSPLPAAILPVPYVAVMAEWAAREGAFLAILSPDGAIRESVGSEAPGLPPLRERPELAEARAGRLTTRARMTPDRKFMYYHIARPIKDTRGHPIGIAYVSQHTDAIIQAINRLLRNQRRAAGLALGVAALAAGGLAWTLTWRLRRLMRQTRAYAQGLADIPSPPRGRDEIATLGRALHDMAGEIERRHRYNRDFMRMTVHELRSPLTGMTGAIEILDRDQVDPAVRRRFTDNLRHAVGRLHRLSGELADLTHVDAEPLREQAATFDYTAFAREAVARLLDSFETGHAPLELCLPDVSLRVHGIPGRLEQVLGNLLENAFRHTPVDGRVTLTIRREGARIVTEVGDTGEGIIPANLARVFDAFFTTRPRGAGRPGGSGLGLTIARAIVEQHRGHLTATSVPGQGACFRFDLPMG